jgi:hypothetical protein
VIEEKVCEEYKGKRAPLCEHAKPATMYVSRSEKNLGRPFFKCGQRDEERCGYFQWGDAPPTRKTLENWEPTKLDKATMTDPVLPTLKIKKRKTIKEGDSATS